MGYVAVMGSCVACGCPFMFSPTRVPSVIFDGRREPLCADCVDRANVIRAERGLEPIPVLPGAYEADDEAEVPWNDD